MRQGLDNAQAPTGRSANSQAQDEAMDERWVLLGGGALARVLVDMFGRQRFAALYVEPGFPALEIPGLPVLNTLVAAREHGGHFVAAVGQPALRRRLMQAALAAGLAPAPPLVSAQASVAGDVQLGPGCVIGHQCVVGPGARLAAQVLLMPGVILGHDVVVEENSVLCAGTVMGGGSALGHDGFVGLNATLVPRIRLAPGCVVGAAALCLDDVTVASRLVGNPAQAQPIAAPA